MALAHAPQPRALTLDELRQLVRQTPSRMRRAPFAPAHVGLTKARSIRTRVGGWLWDRIVDMLHQELDRLGVDYKDSADLEALYWRKAQEAVSMVHDDDRTPREAVRIVAWAIREAWHEELERRALWRMERGLL